MNVDRDAARARTATGDRLRSRCRSARRAVTDRGADKVKAYDRLDSGLRKDLAALAKLKGSAKPIDGGLEVTFGKFGKVRVTNDGGTHRIEFP